MFRLERQVYATPSTEKLLPRLGEEGRGSFRTADEAGEVEFGSGRRRR